MTGTATESNAKLPFAYDERILIRSSSTGAWQASSPSTTTKTIRLESLAQWKDDVWIHPFSDIDMGLSSNNMYKDQISRVEMSISSHGAQRFPTGKGLDHLPTLPLWSDDRQQDSMMNLPQNERYLTQPQGFFLSIRPVDGLTPDKETKAVQAVFQELIRSRLLTTPVIGGEWDLIEDIKGRLYQLVLPFDGAAWSSDALAQSFRRTLPDVCDEEHQDRFFGWSALEWSNFLVGYKDGGGELGQGDTQSVQHLTYNKLMWWTWTSSSSSENNDNKTNNEQSISFGIQYQTTVPPETRDWLPENFVDKNKKCPMGKRTAFEVLSREDTATTNSYQLVPIVGINEETSREEQQTSTNFLYSAGINQVLRRHHTNQGRFESSIELNPLFDMDNDDNSILSCQLKYRQSFPNFLTPMWRSLRIINSDNNDASTVGDAFYANSDQLQPSVTWNQRDQSSILTVEAFSHPINAKSLPSTFSVSFEYAPSFLTIDDFPGDPNRGRVLPPASVTVRCEGHSTDTIVYSNGLLLLPPVPDLSMPFNVISLTSSLYAYIIGAIITILVRKGSEKIKYKIYPDKKPASKLTKFKTKLREKVGIVKEKIMGKNDVNAKQEKDSSQCESTSATDSKSE